MVVATIGLLVWFVIIPQINIGGLPFMGNRDVVPFHQYFSLNPEVTHVVMDDQLLREVSPLVETRDGSHNVYMPVSFLRSIDPFLFWDNSANTLFASTRYEMLEFIPNRLNYYANGNSHPLDTPIRREGGEVFLPASIVEGLYPLAVEYLPERPYSVK